MTTLHHLIDGRPVEGASGRFGDVYNPSQGQVIRKVPLASVAETEAAIASSKATFESWSRITPLQRSRILFKYKALLDANTDKLARLISEEHGKVLSDARGEVIRGAEVVEFACGIPQMLKGNFSQDVGRGIDCFDARRPLGVCAGITPFNFPAMVPMWMFPVAIACGNTFVLKPSERDPSSVQLSIELLTEAGLPPGVVNLVHGDKEAVDVLLTHPDVKAVSFVGSTPIARYIYETGARHGKRVQALGGAKNHLIVMPDANLDEAVNGLMGAAYGSAGERCMAISVAVAVGDVGDRLVEALLPRIKALKVAQSDADGAEMGPLVTAVHRDRVAGYIGTGVEEGADLVVDGRGFSAEGAPNGFFIGPCLFDNVKAEMKIYREEIFGPVLCVVRVPDFESAMNLMNDHEFANGASIYTQCGRTARDFVAGAEAGMQGINVPIPVPMAFHSFGGAKNSLFGAHGMHGDEGIHFYTKLRTVTSRWPATVTETSFNMPTMK